MIVREEREAVRLTCTREKSISQFIAISHLILRLHQGDQVFDLHVFLLHASLTGGWAGRWPWALLRDRKVFRKVWKATWNCVVFQYFLGQFLLVTILIAVATVTYKSRVFEVPWANSAARSRRESFTRNPPKPSFEDGWILWELVKADGRVLDRAVVAGFATRCTASEHHFTT